MFSGEIPHFPPLFQRYRRRGKPAGGPPRRPVRLLHRGLVIRALIDIPGLNGQDTGMRGLHLISFIPVYLWSVAALAHTPVPLDEVPHEVVQAVTERSPALVISDASYEITGKGLKIYVIKGKAEERALAFEVIADGFVLHVYDLEYFESHIED